MAGVRLGEPHALLGQLPDDVEGLVSLLGLEAIDRENDLLDGLVFPPQCVGVLLPCGKHHLIMPDVPGDRVRGQLDLVGVPELGLDLRNRLGLYGAYFFGMAGIGFCLPFLPLYLKEEKGFSDRGIALVWMLSAAAGLLEGHSNEGMRVEVTTEFATV